MEKIECYLFISILYKIDKTAHPLITRERRFSYEKGSCVELPTIPV